MLCSLSKLDDDGLESIKGLETDMGSPVLAYSCHDYAPAQLSDDQLTKLRSLEKELNVALVAVKE